MNPRSIGRRLRAAANRDLVPTNVTSLGVADGLLTHALADVYSRLMRARLGRDRLRLVVVGTDRRLFDSLEMVTDCGYELAGHIGAGEDRFRPALTDLESVDVVLLGAGESNPLERPALPIGDLRDSIWRVLHGFRPATFASCLNIYKLAAVAICLALTPDGSPVVECGCYRAGTTIFMAALLRDWKQLRVVYGLDTFDGMPPPTMKDGLTVYEAGLFADADYSAAMNAVQAHGLSDRIHLHKGLVQDTLSGLDLEAVSFLLSDTDQYAGTASSLHDLLPKLASGGLVAIDDYSVEGVRTAIDESSSKDPELTGLEVTRNLYVCWRSAVPSLAPIS